MKNKDNNKLKSDVIQEDKIVQEAKFPCPLCGTELTRGVKKCHICNSTFGTPEN